MSSLFKQIEAVVSPLPGWATVEKAQMLASFVIALRPEITVEVGVYGGRSFLGLALAHKHIGHGVAWAIDPWNTTTAMEGYSAENADWWKDQNLNKIHDEFMRNINVMGLQKEVKIMRNRSDDVMPPENIGIYHCDGSHTEQAVRDVLRFAPKVKAGGIVVMDDLAWANGSDQPVLRATEELKKLGFVQLCPLDTGAVFKRVSIT